MASALPRRMVGVAFSLVLAAIFVATATGTAQAADGYRYWNYFHVKGTSYVFAQVGASGYTPKNDAIEAYRYGTSTTTNGLAPRADLTDYTIDKICAGLEPDAGKKRVGVLLDYGTTSDAASGETPPAPRAACAVVAKDANGQQVLEAVADVRFDKLTCGIDGYPVKSCSVTVKSPAKQPAQKNVTFAVPETAAAGAHSQPTKARSDDNSNLTAPLVGAGVVLVLLVGGGIVLTRRNKSA